MRLEKLISLLKQKESKRLEFKKFRDEISATLFETVCAFLNREGGEIIIGADDDGKIIGIEESRIDRMMNNLQLGWVEEVGSGIYNITKYLPFYTKGTAKAEFIDDNIFKTVIPYRLATDDEPEEQKAASESELIPQESAETTEGVHRVREYISKNYGCKSKKISEDLGIPLRSVGRYIQILKLSGVVKFTGASRNGGYVRVGYIDLGRANSESGRVNGIVNEGVNEPEKINVPDNEPLNATKDATKDATISDLQREIIDEISLNDEITYSELADKLKKERTTVYRNIKKLIELKMLKREGGRKLGRWVVIKK